VPVDKMNTERNLKQADASSGLDPGVRIFLAGHRGMVGSAIERELRKQGYGNLIMRSRTELDLTDQQTVALFFRKEKIDVTFLAAARVGGIHANNTYPAEFIYQNLMIEANVIHSAYQSGVRRLLFLGSSCIYPKFAPQPMKEEYLLSGPLEPTNEPYAIAKIAGLNLCESYNRQYGTSYRAVMPTNLYGPNDNFDMETSHVLPAMIRKFHLAKLAAESSWDQIEKDAAIFGAIPQDVFENLKNIESRIREGLTPTLTLWGSGKAKREFLHVSDLASACVFLMKFSDERWNQILGDAPQGLGSFVNIGAGKDLAISELADKTAGIIGFNGATNWDPEKPDGTPKKLLDVSRLSLLGWKPLIDLDDGIKATYQAYQDQTL
jgi:GDP-L-fucose synthase